MEKIKIYKAINDQWYITYKDKGTALTTEQVNWLGLDKESESE